MTCHYTNTDWLDVLYNCVRNTKGGVVDAARFLTERRGKSIHSESLRAKLKRNEGEAISVEMALLLSEWMEEKEGGAQYARDWLLAMCAAEGLHVDVVPAAPENGWVDEIAAVQSKVMQIAAISGRVAGVAVESMVDGKIDQAEADSIVGLAREGRTMLHRLERNVLRAVGDKP